MQKTRKAIVLYSPHSGRAGQLPQALHYLERTSLEVAQLISIAELDGLPPQGQHWQEQDIDLVIAAGGDGLIGGAITHIAESMLPLGMLPLGTANDIARSLTIPQNLQQAVEVIVRGQISLVDLGVAQPAEQTPHPASLQPGETVPVQVQREKHGFFAHALTIGLNVQFARLATNVATRQRYGQWTYPVAALAVLMNHTSLPINLSFIGLVSQQTPIATPEDVVGFHCRALHVAIINAPIFGGQWNLALPRARIDDHLLDIVIVEDIDIIAHSLNTLRQLFTDSPPWISSEPTLSSEHSRLHPAELLHLPGIHHVQAHGVVITSTVDPQDVTLDGEVRGQTPLYAHMAKQALRIIVE